MISRVFVLGPRHARLGRFHVLACEREGGGDVLSARAHVDGLVSLGCGQSVIYDEPLICQVR